jgi:hypothetical protein
VGCHTPKKGCQSPLTVTSILVDALESQMHGVAIAGENKNGIDGHRHGPPYRGVPIDPSRSLTRHVHTKDRQDETRRTVPFALESEAIPVRITVSEHVRTALVTYLSSLKWRSTVRNTP